MLDGGMRSPWEENSRKTEGDNMFQGDQGNEFLGQLLERSTSAPPLASETNAPIGGHKYEEDAESVSEKHEVYAASFIRKNSPLHLCISFTLNSTVFVWREKTKIDGIKIRVI